MISTKKGDFQIISDWVVNKTPQRYNTRISSAKPYTIFFAKSGKFGIPYGDNYRWSTLYPFNDKTIYETSSLNDDFYVVSIGKQKNIIAYNKKYFEFKE